MSVPAMTQGTAVVIGATRNLGLYIARHLANRGWSVIGIGRSAPEDAYGVRFVPVDLGWREETEIIAR